jgi:hypothetical protein
MIGIMTEKQILKCKNLATKHKAKLINLCDLALIGKKIPESMFWLNIGDISYLIKFYSLVECGNFKEAYKAMNNMDTMTYEGIPEGIHTILYDAVGGLYWKKEMKSRNNVI